MMVLLLIAVAAAVAIHLTVLFLSVCIYYDFNFKIKKSDKNLIFHIMKRRYCTGILHTANNPNIVQTNDGLYGW